MSGRDERDGDGVVVCTDDEAFEMVDGRAVSDAEVIKGQEEPAALRGARAITLPIM